MKAPHDEARLCERARRANLLKQKNNKIKHLQELLMSAYSALENSEHHALRYDISRELAPDAR